MKKASRSITLLVLLSVVLVACGTGTGTGITVSGAWSRQSPQMAHAGAVFLVIQNGGKAADFLVGASTEVCETVELHESIIENDVMKMRPVEGGRIEVPVGGTVELKPGGLHLMLINLTALPEAGSRFELALEFEKAGVVLVEVEVRDPASLGMGG